MYFFRVFVLLLPIFSDATSFSLYETCSCSNQYITQRMEAEVSRYCIPGNKIWLECLFKEPIDLLKNYFVPGPQCGGPIWHQNELEQTKKLAKHVTAAQCEAVHQDTYKIPKACFFASSIAGLNQFSPPEKNAYYFCNHEYKMGGIEVSGCEPQNSCQLENTLHPDLYQDQKEQEAKKFCNSSPCINKSYIDHTAGAFNRITDCFGFTSKKDKEKIFALFHHESRFLINKVEKDICIKTGADSNSKDCKTKRKKEDRKISTARCYGQVENQVIIDMNKYLHFGHKEAQIPVEKNFDYGAIYHEALKRCPFLIQAIVPDPRKFQDTVIDSDDDPNTDSDNTFLKLHQEQAEAIICRTSQDPYSCLFYAIFNLKVNMKRMSNKIKEAIPFPSNVPWPSVIQEKIPDKPLINEMLMLTGTLNTTSGEPVTVQEYMRNNRGLKENLEKPHIRSLDGLSVVKTKLFDVDQSREELVWAFAFFSHNGGLGVIRPQFAAFIADLKDKIADSKHKNCNKDKLTEHEYNKCQRYKRYRSSIQAGKPLTAKELIEEFSRIKEEEGNTQLSEFVEHVNGDLAAFSNQRNTLTNALTAVHSNRVAGRQPSQIDRDWFLNYVQDKCPSKLSY